MIRIKELCKCYTIGDENVHALDHANLHVRQGEFVSIIGPSGSGKSTRMNIIGCLDTADSGNISSTASPSRTTRKKSSPARETARSGSYFRAST